MNGTAFMTLQHKAALEIEDANEIQRLLEERAESDIGGKEFMEWLSEHDSLADLGLCSVTDAAGISDYCRSRELASQILRDWIAYRVETMDPWVRADIERSVLDPSEEAY